MRVTNGMMRTNSMLNMQKNKLAYDKYLTQYNTQKKIQRPSDDPTIAVRALKYRTTLAEIEQYQRNIEDATSWMDATETAIKDVDKVLDSMVQYVTQAATGTVNAKDREDINKQLDQFAQYIYEQDMNADYAGRYLFTGYRTDSALLFDKAQDNVLYTIHEQLEVSDIRKYDYVYGRAEIGAGKTAQDYADEAPKFQSTNRILVSYQDLVDADASLTTTFDPAAKGPDGSSVASVTGPYIVFKDKDGDEYIKEVTIKRIADDIDTSVTPPTGTYNEHLNPGADDVYLIPETGELVFGDSIYDVIRGGSDLGITYQKKEFDKNDIKPEHYFVCETLDDNGLKYIYNTDSDNLGDTDIYNNFTPRPQEIQYQINFSQTIQVNTEAYKAVGTIVGRSIEDIKNSCNELDVIEAKMSEVEKRIKDLDEGSQADEIANLTELKNQLQTQMDLQKSVLVKGLGAMITTIQGAKDKINVALADHGSRYNRMVMTKNKIDELEIDTNQAKSDNEDADLGEAYINFTESNLLYQATLNATSKVLGQSLLDFI
ncbi:MAG: flagellin [Eubacterium sp.]|nr:flagellin [Eubacterium sp.]